MWFFLIPQLSSHNLSFCSLSYTITFLLSVVPCFLPFAWLRIFLFYKQKIRRYWLMKVSQKVCFLLNKTISTSYSFCFNKWYHKPTQKYFLFPAKVSYFLSQLSSNQTLQALSILTQKVTWSTFKRSANPYGRFSPVRAIQARRFVSTSWSKTVFLQE